MKYLTLHQSEEDYANLVLDANNTPHVAFIVGNTPPVYKRKVNNAPDGYQLFNAADGEFLDKDNNQIYVK
jgi:hypothetical protein